MKRVFFLGLLALLLTEGLSSSALAGQVGEICIQQEPSVPQWRPPAFVETLPEDLKKELDPTYLRWIDATFLFDARKERD